MECDRRMDGWPKERTDRHESIGLSGWSRETNKTQYHGFPGKSQNSKKFRAKFQQNQTISKNHRGFLNILGGLKYPQGVKTLFGVKITSKWIQHRQNTQCADFQQNLTTFKNQYHRGVLNILGSSNAPRRSKQLFGVKISSKMDSASSYYSECKFSAQSDNF